MIIVVGSDLAGYRLKKHCIGFIESLGHEVIDIGCKDEHDDMVFPDIARTMAPYITEGKADRGIAFCGTGVGISVALNKFPGVRASVVHDIQTAHQAVEHDDVQVMCIGEKIVGEWLAEDLIPVFLEAKFNTGERFQRMVEMLCEIDGSEFKRAE